MNCNIFVAYESTEQRHEIRQWCKDSFVRDAWSCNLSPIDPFTIDFVFTHEKYKMLFEMRWINEAHLFKNRDEYLDWRGRTINAFGASSGVGKSMYNTQSINRIKRRTPKDNYKIYMLKNRYATTN